jgi:hypothetical protein
VKVTHPRSICYIAIDSFIFDVLGGIGTYKVGCVKFVASKDANNKCSVLVCEAVAKQL